MGVFVDKFSLLGFHLGFIVSFYFIAYKKDIGKF